MRNWIGTVLARVACWIAGVDCPCDFCDIWDREGWEPHKEGAEA